MHALEGSLPGDRLDFESYEIIILRIWSELSFEQIAELLDCSVSAIHRRFRIALDELRAILKELEQSHARP